jgi:hydrogenase expression/formation protein HypC
MCLAIPGRVVEIIGKDEAIVDFHGIRRRINLALVGEVKVGDWLIVHTGFAIRKMGEKEAQETLRLIEEVLKAIT